MPKGGGKSGGGGFSTGFGKGGVSKGSAAASYQSSHGQVSKGSSFSAMQSAGAKGQMSGNGGFTSSGVFGGSSASRF